MLSNFSPPGMTAEYRGLNRQHYICENILSLKHKERFLETHDLRSSHRHEANLAFSEQSQRIRQMIGVTLLPASRQEKDPDRLSSPRPELRSYKAKKNTKKNNYNNKNHSTVHWKVTCTHPPTHANRIQTTPREATGINLFSSCLLVKQ